MRAARYLGTRLALAVITLFVISGVTFFATNVVPSDPARVALVLLVLLGVEAGILPLESSAAALGSGADEFKAYVLPVLTLAILLTPYIFRMVRVSVRDTISSPFVRAAILRGFPRWRVVW